MTLRLPLRPSPQSASAVAHERLALETRELDGPRSREIVVTTVGVLEPRPRERPALRSVLPQLAEEPA